MEESLKILICLDLTILYSFLFAIISPSIMGIWLSGATTGAMILWIVKYWKEQK